MLEDEHSGLTRHLLAIVTGLLEDAASLAADGQAPLSTETRRQIAAAIDATLSQALVILRAIHGLPPG